MRVSPARSRHPVGARTPAGSHKHRAPGGVVAPRDSQRARVYAWENRVVGPHDPSTVAFAQAQGFVDAVWSEAGLAYPPAIEKLPAQARSTMADASRLRIRVPSALPAWCLLHEIAHAMTTTMDGASDGHGSRFMGVYVGLLARYLRLPAADLIASAAAEGIATEAGARPIFLDA